MKFFVEKIIVDKKIYNGIIIFVQVIFFFLCWKCKVLRLEGNDDYWMNTFLNGSYGEYYYDDLFSNIIFSTPIALLYKYFPLCNWLFVSYLVICHIGYFVLSDILWDCFEEKQLSIIIFCSLFFSTSKYTWLMLTFTRTAGFISAIAIIYYVHSVKREIRYKQIIAELLFVLGFLIRKKAALLLVPFFVCIFLFVIKDKFRNNIKQIVIMAIVLIFINTINGYYYSQEPLKSALERQKYAALILDYEQLNDEELSTIDFKLDNGTTMLGYILKWTYNDSKNISNDFMKNALIEFNKVRIRNRIVHLLEKVGLSLHNIMSHNLTYLCILFILLSMFLTRSFKKRYYLIILLMIFIDVFFSVNGRAVDRVVVIPMIVSVLFYAYILGVDHYKYEKKQVLICSLFLVSIWGACNNTNFSLYYLERISYEERIIDFKEHVDKNGFFIFSVPNSKAEGYLLELGKPQYGVYKNVVIDNGWPAISPHMLEAIKRRGEQYDNLYELLIDDRNAYYCGNNVLLVKQYIKDFYDLDLDYALNYSSGDMNAYTFSRNYIIEKQKDLLEWNIKLNEEKTDDEYIVLEGNVGSFYNDDMDLRIQIQNEHGDTYTYTISRIINNQFEIGIPTDTWIQNEECCVKMLMIDDDKAIVDDEVYTIDI